MSIIRLTSSPSYTLYQRLPSKGPTGPAQGSSAPILGPLFSFPFAQGYKVNSTLTGGRVIGGGEIRRVTNLNNSGVGSLRQALSTPGPADIVFEVSGIIALANQGPQIGVNGADMNITVWGETAPSPGITIMPNAAYPNSALPVWAIRGNNIVWRHLRWRMGQQVGASGGLQLVQLFNTASTSFRQLFANCSFAYNCDEMVGIATQDGLDITLYRCILGPGSNSDCKCLLLTGLDAAQYSGRQIALIQNMFMLSIDRGPEFHSGAAFVMYNNYHYAYGNSPAVGSGCGAGFHTAGFGKGDQRPVFVSARGNVYEGNALINRPQFQFGSAGADAPLGNTGSQSYFNDNVNVIRCIEPGSTVTAVVNETDLGMVLPEVGPTLVLSSANVKSHLIGHAGSRPLNRDQLDTDTINHCINGDGNVITSAAPLYTLGSGSRALSIPANWNQQAPEEELGWRVLDRWIYQNFTQIVEAP